MVRRSISSRRSSPQVFCAAFIIGVAAARAEERVHRVVGEALVGLPRRLVHRGKRGARGRRQPEAELGIVGARELRCRKAVDRRERHQRVRHPLADHAHLFRLAREAEHHVGAGLGEGFAAADRFVDAAGAARIGARDDHEVRIGARGQRLLELLHEELGRHQMIDADVVLDPPRQELVLDLDRREARGLGERDGAVHVHGVAPAAAGVEHQRQLAGRADVDRDVGHFRQRQIGLGDVLHPAERPAREIDRLEARLLGEQRHDRVAHDRRDDEVVAANELLERCQIQLPCLRLIGSDRSMGKQVAKLKVMCARSMHQVVGALTDAFRRDSGHEVELSFGTVGALQKRLDAGETADVLILGAPAIDKLAQAGAVSGATKIATTSVGIAVRDGTVAAGHLDARRLQAGAGCGPQDRVQRCRGRRLGRHLSRQAVRRDGACRRDRAQGHAAAVRRRGREPRRQRRGRYRHDADRGDRADPGRARDRPPARAARQRHDLCRAR